MTATPLDLTEKALQAQIRKMLNDFGWRTAVTWVSLNSPKGWPDLFAVRGCEFVAIEVKREKGKVSPEQVAWLSALAQLPGARFVGVIRPSDWFNAVLDDVLIGHGEGQWLGYGLPEDA